MVKQRINYRKRKIGECFRKLIRNKLERARLHNKSFSIIANNCVGGVIYSDLGCRFNSPTVNLFITPIDFVKVLENIHWYLEQEPEEISSNLPYPVARLGGRDGITIYFVHYNTFEEAAEKWSIRKARINWDNMFVIMDDRYCLPYESRKRFDELPYNKVLFTVNDYAEIKCSRLLKKSNDGVCVGIAAYIQNIFGKRLYQYAENFNIIKWLNGEKT